MVSVRLGNIQQVGYNLGEWAVVPADFITYGRTVRLAEYQRQPANTLEVLGVDRSRIVVSPYTDPDQTHETTMTAAAPNNDSSAQSTVSS